MTNTDLTSFIMQDAGEFWANSVNPINSDSLFIKAGIYDVKEARNFQNSENGIIVRALFENTYVVVGEYIVSYMNSMLITNRRLFTFYTGTIKSIALKSIIKYDHIANEGLTLIYHEAGIVQTIKISASTLRADIVNNTLAIHQNDIITNQEMTLLSDTKIVLDAKFDLSALTAVQHISQQSVNEAREFNRRGNRNGLIKLIAIILLIGGCGYTLSNWGDSQKGSGAAYTPTHTKHQKKCPWCGGIGRVGYAGESKAQVERTGMGLGNYCTTCTGTGYIDEDKE